MVKQNVFVTLASSLILSAMIFFPAASNAGLPVPPLPPLIIPAPPPVFLIPGTYTYFAPDVDVDLFFHRGFWYRPYGGRWYRSSHYGGPWGFIAPRRVPGVLINLPPGYRNVPPGHERIPYGQLKKTGGAGSGEDIGINQRVMENGTTKGEETNDPSANSAKDMAGVTADDQCNPFSAGGIREKSFPCSCHIHCAVTGDLDVRLLSSDKSSHRFDPL